MKVLYTRTFTQCLSKKMQSLKKSEYNALKKEFQKEVENRYSCRSNACKGGFEIQDKTIIITNAVLESAFKNAIYTAISTPEKQTCLHLQMEINGIDEFVKIVP